MPSVGTRPAWGLQSGVIIVSTQGLLYPPTQPQHSMLPVFTVTHHCAQITQGRQKEELEVEPNECTLDGSQSGFPKKL